MPSGNNGPDPEGDRCSTRPERMPVSTPSRPTALRTPVGRRSVLTAAAWSVPVIVASTATPSVAASTPASALLTLSEGPSSLAAVRGKTVPAVTFTTLEDGAPTQTSDPVMVTLTPGLQFTATPGSETVTLLASAAGLVVVPEITAIGTQGTYSYQVSFGTSVRTVTIQVTATAGIPFSVGLAGNMDKGPTRLSSSLMSDPRVIDNAWTMLDETKTLWFGGTRLNVSTLTKSALTGVTAHVLGTSQSNASLCTSLTVTQGKLRYMWGTTAVGGPFAGTGYYPGGWSGTLTDLFTANGLNTVHTENGVYYNGFALGISQTGDLAMITGSSNARLLHSWASDASGTERGGGAFVNSSGLIVEFFSLTKSAPTVNQYAAPAGGVRQLRAGVNSLVVLTESDEVWVRGSAWAAPSGWVKLASGVRSLDTWTNSTSSSNDNGIVTIGHDGSVASYVGSGTVVGPTPIGGFDGVSAVHVDAYNGCSVLADSEGQLWTWQGNADAPAVLTAERFSALDSEGTAMNYASYGHRSGSTYLGYGVVIV